MCYYCLVCAQVELRRIAGQFPQDHICESVSETSTDSGNRDEEEITTENQVTIRVSFITKTSYIIILYV